jgi:uronate dehydrogenase
MRILIAGNGGLLARAVARPLGAAHDIRVVDAAAALDREAAAEATAGQDVVIHFPLFAEAAPSAVHAPDALARLDLAGRATFNLITTASSASTFVLVSTLRHFERYPAAWLVTERWAPHPTAHVDDLAPYLAEIVVRETSRVLALKGIALRLGEVVSAEAFGADGGDPRRVHLEDAVQAVERAVAFAPTGNGWWVFHTPAAGPAARFPIGQAGEAGFGYAPRHEARRALAGEPAAPATAVGGRRAGARGRDDAPERVAVFGAGGPIAAAFAASAAEDHTLRLLDLRPLAEIVAAGKPQGPGAPVPRLLPPPHEARVADVTDPAQVLDAVEGMDAIVNLTAMRNHPVEAFRVNVLGPYNLMRAAVARGIGRVVLSGPAQVTMGGPAGYTYDTDELSADVPARPGTEPYHLSKLLGQHIGRIFAQEHGIEAPCLLIGPLLNPSLDERPPNAPHGAYPFSVAWADAGEAVHRALHAAPLPRPFEPFFVVGDMPHGRFSNEKTKRLLGWEPRDRLERHWLRKPG